MFVAIDMATHMVDVAQSAEHLVVVQGVAGSSPVFHPIVLSRVIVYERVAAQGFFVGSGC